MKRSEYRFLVLLVVVALLAMSASVVGASGSAPVSDWSSWQANFTPIVPPSPNGPGSPAGLPIPTKSPSNASLQAWVNMIPSFPEPSMAAHAEEVARGDNHSTIVGHGPAATGLAARNEWAFGNQLLSSANPGPFFETFDHFYGTTWRMIPDNWGGYAYRGAD
ncbi:MAG TPA: hypothetical protein P5148_12240, partial [Anaerolineae bacterium]|nr:hypothetical protein [Anaerolineae bacterium]